MQTKESKIKRTFVIAENMQIEIIEMKEVFEAECGRTIGKGVQLAKVSNISRMIRKIDVTQELLKYGINVIFLSRNDLKELGIENAMNHKRLKFVTLTDLKSFLLKKNKKKLFSVFDEMVNEQKKLKEIEVHEKPSPFKKVTDELEVIQNKARLYDEMIEKQKKIKEKTIQNTDRYYKKLNEKEEKLLNVVTEVFEEIAKNIEETVGIDEILEINNQIYELENEFGYIFDMHEAMGYEGVETNSRIKRKINEKLIKIIEKQ